jgi:hypothetical protein
MSNVIVQPIANKVLITDQGISVVSVGIQGPEGPTGPQGDIGPQGIQGIQGPIGNTGPQGPQGIGSSPGGIDGDIQYNNSGSFDGITAVPIAHGGTGQTTASNAINALLPSQIGQNGKVLITSGTTTSWQTVSANPGGSSGQIQYNASGSFAGASGVTYDDHRFGLNVATPTHVLDVKSVDGSSLVRFDIANAVGVRWLELTTSDGANLYGAYQVDVYGYDILSTYNITLLPRDAGGVGIGENQGQYVTDSKLYVKAGSTTQVGIIVRGQPSQSANLQEWYPTPSSTQPVAILSGTYTTGPILFLSGNTSPEFGANAINGLEVRGSICTVGGFATKTGGGNLVTASCVGDVFRFRENNITGNIPLAMDMIANAIGFYNVTPVTRQLLATGAGHTVDDVITALQNLGLLRQS